MRMIYIYIYIERERERGKCVIKHSSTNLIDFNSLTLLKSLLEKKSYKVVFLDEKKIVFVNAVI